MADSRLPAVAAPTPPPAQALAMGSSPLRGGKRHIDEAVVAYNASLELPLASGKKMYRSNSHSLTDGTIGASGQSPRGGAPATSNTTSAVFGSGPDGDSSPYLARKYNVALHADMKLKNVQARMEAAKALRLSKGGDAPEEDLDDEGNLKSPKKKGGLPAGDYSPRKRIEDFLFLKQGKQWCPPTRYNGSIPQPPPPKKKEEPQQPPMDPEAKKQKQEEFIERLNKPLKRENKKKAKKDGGPYTVIDRTGKKLEGEEAEAYRRQIVPKMMERLEGDKEKRKKEREIALKKKEKEEASLQKESKKLTDDEALAHNISKLFTEPINKKRTNAIAREKKEAAERAKSPRLSKKEHAESGKRMFEEGVEKQRQAVAKAAERYLLRPASAAPTAAYNRSHDIESKYCPGLDLGSISTPRPVSAQVSVPKVPRPPASARN